MLWTDVYFTLPTDEPSCSPILQYKMQLLSLTVAALAFLPTPATAWHLQVHNQIAFVAEKLLQPRTLNITGALLDPKWNHSIGRAAGWADTVRKDYAPYSYNWHFVGMNETLPNLCPLTWDGICAGGDCVVAQITNQTRILRGCIQKVKDHEYDFSHPDLNCQQALMWVVHLIGDVAQPLHTSSTKTGGNGEKVLFNNTASNLHDVWDRWILYAGTSKWEGFDDQQLDPYFGGLLDRIGKDMFKVPRKDWSACGFDVDQGAQCPKAWAEDSHWLVCKAVYTSTFTNATDLFKTGYAEKMFPIVELQLAKASWRLAGWLNALVESVYSGQESEYVTQYKQAL